MTSPAAFLAPPPLLSRPRATGVCLQRRLCTRCAASAPDSSDLSAVIAPPAAPPRVPSTSDLSSDSLDVMADIVPVDLDEKLTALATENAQKGEQVYPFSPVMSVAGAAGLLALAAFLLHGGDSELVPVTLDMPQSGGGLFAAISEFIEGPRFLVSMGLGVSAFIQALTGFGFAVVSVGALTQLDWIVHSSVFDTVQPVAATLGALTGWILLAPELQRVRWRNIRTLLIATTLATPIGALALEHIDAALVIRSLGAVISGYVAYSLLGIEVPKRFGGKGGAWALGLIAGALGGAFDITGPPLVVHGEAAGWDTSNGEFRRNVLAVVSVNSTLVVLWDFFSGRLEDFYYFDFLKYAAPTVVLGIIVGNYLSTKLDPAAFKKIVLGTCALLGIKLLLS